MPNEDQTYIASDNIEEVLQLIRTVHGECSSVAQQDLDRAIELLDEALLALE